MVSSLSLLSCKFSVSVKDPDKKMYKNQALNIAKKHKKIPNLSEEQKGNKQQQKPQQYGCEGYKNLSEDGKQRLVEYITIYMKKWKNVS